MQIFNVSVIGKLIRVATNVSEVSQVRRVNSKPRPFGSVTRFGRDFAIWLKMFQTPPIKTNFDTRSVKWQ
jgi:hypothetical protein